MDKDYFDIIPWYHENSYGSKINKACEFEDAAEISIEFDQK
jgi:hypothetical protein